MKGLQRFEAFAEQLLEGSLGRLMGGRLEPVELAKRLARVMEDQQTIGAGKVFVPNRYHIHLNAADLDHFKPFQGGLEHELALYLAETAERRQYHFIGRPHISLHPDPNVKQGDTRIIAQLMDAQGVGLAGPGMTQELQVGQIQTASTPTQPPPATTVAWLSDGGREVPLRGQRLSLGRALDNDLILEGPGVSRRHAEVEKRHGRYVLRDLGSTHGTQVNGQRIDEVVLRDGDVILLGGQKLVFRVTVAPSADERGAATPPGSDPRPRGA